MNLSIPSLTTHKINVNIILDHESPFDCKRVSEPFLMKEGTTPIAVPLFFCLAAVSYTHLRAHET